LHPALFVDTVTKLRLVKNHFVAIRFSHLERRRNFGPKLPTTLPS
jgi:hypothetical protein